MHHSKSASLSRCLAVSLTFCGILAFTTTTRAAIVGPYTPDSATLHLWHLDELTVPAVDSAIPGATNLTALANGATLGNPSLSEVFGTALSTVDGGQEGAALAAARDAYLALRPLANSAADNTTMVFADPVTGAFTMEALVRIDFDPQLNMGPAAFIHNDVAGNGRNAPMQIISGENESGAGNTRSWQFRLVPIGFVPGANSGVTTNITQPGIEFINVLPLTQGFVAFPPTDGPNALVSNQGTMSL